MGKAALRGTFPKPQSSPYRTLGNFALCGERPEALPYMKEPALSCRTPQAFEKACAKLLIWTKLKRFVLTLFFRPPKKLHTQYNQPFCVSKRYRFAMIRNGDSVPKPLPGIALKRGDSKASESPSINSSEIPLSLRLSRALPAA